MRTSTRRGAVAGAVAALVALAGAAAPGVAVADSTAPPAYVSGWLALRTGATNDVRLVTSTGSVLATQTLSTNTSCAMSSRGSQLMLFSGSGTAYVGVGLNSGSIGVRDKQNANGTSCSAVDASNAESLTLALGGGTTALRGNGLPVALSASLDVDLKQNAQILAVAFLGGAPVARYELVSGSTITSPVAIPAGLPGADLPIAETRQCNNPSDSGPDAGALNNCRWNLSHPSWTGAPDTTAFDTLTLYAVSGSFSLQGGSDGQVDDPAAPMPGYLGDAQYASLLELADGVVGCGGTATLRTSSAVPTSQWKRLGATGSCAAYPYASSTGTADGRPYAHFVKPFDTPTAQAQAEWSTTFTYSGKVPTLEFAFDLPGGTTSPWTSLPLCSDEGVTYDPTTSSYTGWLLDPNGNYACLLNTQTANTKGTKTVTFTAFVVGDAGMRY